MYTRKHITKVREFAREHGVRRLLTDPSSNPKVAKNGKVLQVLTAPLHLAPYNISGYQVCPMASKGCAAACLHTSGNPIYMPAKERARIARTRFFFEHRNQFMVLLYAEIATHEKRCHKLGVECAVRPNATSDISWEILKLLNGRTIFECFPAVQFYDYTAVEKRMDKFLQGQLPRNYYLTFSAKEDNDEACIRVLNAGGTVSMPFNVIGKRPLPTTYNGYPVIDADTHDYRPDDPPGHIAGLRAKGKAKHDTSGFVRRVS